MAALGIDTQLSPNGCGFWGYPGEGERSSRIAEMHSAFFLAVARLNLLLRGILRGNIVDERIGDGLVGRVPVGDDFPALAVPLLYAPVPRALVVGAGNLNRLQHTLEAHFLNACFREVEVLKTPTDLLTRQRLLAELFLRLPDRLHAEHGIHH